MILSPAEAVPLLLDPVRSPAVGFDTEFTGPSPGTATLNGLSLSGGTAETGYFCVAWTFDQFQTHPWEWIRDRVLLPILRDPNRKFVLHPAKVDMQPLLARGVKPEDIRCQIICTMAMGHCFDENLPAGLKILANGVLGHTDTLSYAQTRDAMKDMESKANKLIKQLVKEVWEHYRDNRRRSKEVEVAIPQDIPSHKQMAMMLRPKMLKADVEGSVKPQIEKVVKARSDREIHERFSRYAAHDAQYTLELFNYFDKNIRPEDREHAALETKICHPIVTQMEMRGLKIDTKLLRSIYDVMEKYIEKLRDDVISRWQPEDWPGFWQRYKPDKDLKAALKQWPHFNPNSSEQVGYILWGEWKVPPPKFVMARGGEIKKKYFNAKTNLCKADKNVLESLMESDHPRAKDVKMLMELRRFVKLQGTYVAPMLEEALADPDERIRSSFWPTGARTGRFSSSDPNVENIPRPNTMPIIPIPKGVNPFEPIEGCRAIVTKNERGKYKNSEGEAVDVIWRVRSLRDVFITNTGWKIVSADLSQVENRLVAHASQDKTMLDLYQSWDCADCGASGKTKEPLHACPKCGAKDGKRNKAHPDQPAVKGFCLGRDIHAKTSVFLKLPERYAREGVPDYGEGRQRAKAVNHGASYGMSPPTLARNEKMPIKEARENLSGWHDCYPGIRPFHKQIEREIKDRGYVELFNGKRRRFGPQKLLLQTGHFERRQWEWEGVVREAVNVIAQGGTAIIMKRAMCRIYDRFQEPDLKGKAFIINQVHDELVIEAHESVAEQVLAIVLWEMENAVELSVPIIAEGAIGNTHGEAH